MDTDTHTWFSRGSAGSVHSPRGLLGSTPRDLADLGFPAESRGGSRPFSSRPGDRQFFSDPSNWAVRNILPWTQRSLEAEPSPTASSPPYFFQVPTRVKGIFWEDTLTGLSA